MPRENVTWGAPRIVDELALLGHTVADSAPRSPWQNPFVERLIGSIRRECTDHIIPMGEKHLLRLLREYAAYFNASRTHHSLGGLHHRYSRVA